jgi:hypothetical protein
VARQPSASACAAQQHAGPRLTWRGDEAAAAATARAAAQRLRQRRDAQQRLAAEHAVASGQRHEAAVAAPRHPQVRHREAALVEAQQQLLLARGAPRGAPHRGAARQRHAVHDGVALRGHNQQAWWGAAASMGG